MSKPYHGIRLAGTFPQILSPFDGKPYPAVLLISYIKEARCEPADRACGLLLLDAGETGGPRGTEEVVTYFHKWNTQFAFCPENPQDALKGSLILLSSFHAGQIFRARDPEEALYQLLIETIRKKTKNLSGIDAWISSYELQVQQFLAQKAENEEDFCPGENYSDRKIKSEQQLPAQSAEKIQPEASSAEHPTRPIKKPIKSSEEPSWGWIIVAVLAIMFLIPCFLPLFF